jgi:DNA polymerase-3 subunit delta'
MAARADAPDRAPAPHPRDSYALEGIEAPALEFERALARGRLHHAWLLTGPEGVGKASFAYRAARRLLGARPDARFGPLGASPEDPVSRMVAARSHPDLLVLERADESGKARRAIPVDEARRLPEFFAKAPAMADYRVAIIDAADDLNVNAANAVLKTLEEPSGKGVLFLVSHAPGRLLATIKSRCRRLAFAPWPEDRLASFVEQRTSAADEDGRRLARLAKGAPGRALSLAASGALELDAVAGKVLERLPQADEAGLMSLTDGFRGGEGAARFSLLMELMAERLHETALVRAGQGGLAGEGDAWGRLWERMTQLPGEVEALNLDRADAFWSLVGDLRATARVQPFRC